MSIYMIINKDSLSALQDMDSNTIQTCITSPPYFGLRDYGHDGQIGLEQSPDEYVGKLVELFREVKRVLKDDGTLWLNLGDSYAMNGLPGGNPSRHGGELRSQAKKRNVPNGLKPKDLIGIPWRVAFALQADGWYLRQDIIWHKPNPMPESVTDRCTKAHEYIFLLSKSKKYYFDNEVIKEPTLTRDNTNRDRDSTRLNNTPGRTRMAGLKTNNYEKRNKRSVWTVNTKPYKGAHFAVFPEELITPCILAGSKKGDVVLDPFAGSGTTLATAKKYGRGYVGIELNPDYIPLIEQRLLSVQEPMI